MFDIPSGWECARLGSIGVSSTGKTPSTQNSTLYDGSIPFIGPGQITLACELLPAEKWLSEAGQNETTIAKTGDILMVFIGGSIGKSAIVNKEMGFNQQINCISPFYFTGYYDQSHMINDFQELYGLSPELLYPQIETSKTIQFSGLLNLAKVAH